ncbi:hypothetical protein N483_20335 [Pseudoalteromonas luteoviolacea NCIMB 1944]|uniref:Uncharacterized protein n=1 Tax=Pseudoalteromonas luteoviolacea (strain 2ta16) TaxID=1353533 RepID=V4J6K4_PSEL2|nr:hypothetical protein PL2TA16_01328 [Pseudoalteromonas luteoviolacea 2ta16]KZN38306.1 hypothetical protein N483_20335 [Pseudoalteromonas luteoviolacea NCIMB 1944]
MSEHYCPNCEEKSFTWSIDEEVSLNTVWNCSLCGFQAEENESLESVCESCGTKNNIHLKSSAHNFCYCTHCKKQTKSGEW